MALRSAAAGLAAARETAEAVKSTGADRMPFTVHAGVFGDEHLQCRSEAFPYRPSVSASHGSPVIEARSTGDVGIAGALLGYLALQEGGYVDDLAVLPAFHGQGIAAGLLAGAASIEEKRRHLSLIHI